MEDIQRKIDQAKEIKNEANEQYKCRHYKKAALAYHKVFAYTRGLINDDSSEMSMYANFLKPPKRTEMGPNEKEEKAMKDHYQTEITQLEITTWNNLAACYIQLENGMKAKEYAKKVLEKHKTNEKGLFRLGQSHRLLQENEKAMEIFTQLLEKNSMKKNEESIKKEMRFIQQKDKEENKRLQKQMRKMFEE